MRGKLFLRKTFVSNKRRGGQTKVRPAGPHAWALIAPSLVGLGEGALSSKGNGDAKVAKVTRLAAATRWVGAENNFKTGNVQSFYLKQFIRSYLAVQRCNFHHFASSCSKLMLLAVLAKR